MSITYAYSLTVVTSLGSLPISMEVKSLPYSVPDDNDTDVDVPPPIPPKQFLEEELFPPPSKHSESGEPHWNGTPSLPPKTNQDGAVLSPHPANVHQKSGEL